MDSSNIENVRNAVKEMSKNNVKRNSWILVRAYDKPVKSNHRGKNSRKLNKLANQNAKKKFHQIVDTLFGKIES